jgi:hypothetical protein
MYEQHQISESLNFKTIEERIYKLKSTQNENTWIEICNFTFNNRRCTNYITHNCFCERHKFYIVKQNNIPYFFNKSMESKSYNLCEINKRLYRNNNKEWKQTCKFIYKDTNEQCMNYSKEKCFCTRHKGGINRERKKLTFIGDNNELFILDLLSSDELVDIECIGRENSEHDIIFKVKDELNLGIDKYRGIQVKTLTLCENSYVITNLGNYSSDTLIVGISNDRKVFCCIFKKEIKCKTKIYINYENQNSDYKDRTFYGMENIEKFKTCLIESCKLSTYYCDSKISYSNSLEKESLRKLEELCIHYKYKFEYEASSDSHIDCRINNRTLQCKFSSLKDHNLYQFRLNKLHNKIRVPYSDKDGVEFFFFENGENEYYIIPTPVLIYFGYIKTDLTLGKNIILLSSSKSEENHWSKKFLGRIDLLFKTETFDIRSILDINEPENIFLHSCNIKNVIVNRNMDKLTTKEFIIYGKRVKLNKCDSNYRVTICYQRNIEEELIKDKFLADFYVFYIDKPNQGYFIFPKEKLIEKKIFTCDHEDNLTIYLCNPYNLTSDRMWMNEFVNNFNQFFEFKDFKIQEIKDEIILEDMVEQTPQEIEDDIKLIKKYYVNIKRNVDTLEEVKKEIGHKICMNSLNALSHIFLQYCHHIGITNDYNVIKISDNDFMICNKKIKFHSSNRQSSNGNLYEYNIDYNKDESKNLIDLYVLHLCIEKINYFYIFTKSALIVNGVLSDSKFNYGEKSKRIKFSVYNPYFIDKCKEWTREYVNNYNLIKMLIYGDNTQTIENIKSQPIENISTPKVFNINDDIYKSDHNKILYYCNINGNINIRKISQNNFESYGMKIKIHIRSDVDNDSKSTYKFDFDIADDYSLADIYILYISKRKEWFYIIPKDILQIEGIFKIGGSKRITIKLNNSFPLSGEYSWMNKYLNRYDLLKNDKFKISENINESIITTKIKYEKFLYYCELNNIINIKKKSPYGEYNINGKGIKIYNSLLPKQQYLFEFNYNRSILQPVLNNMKILQPIFNDKNFADIYILNIEQLPEYFLIIPKYILIEKNIFNDNDLKDNLKNPFILWKNIRISISKSFPISGEYSWMNDYLNRYDLLKDNSEYTATEGTIYDDPNLGSI